RPRYGAAAPGPGRVCRPRPAAIPGLRVRRSWQNGSLAPSRAYFWIGWRDDSRAEARRHEPKALSGGQRAFEAEERALGVEAAGAAVTAHAALREHAMTWNHDRDRVAAAGAAHG